MQYPNMQCQDCGNKYYSASASLLDSERCEACGGDVKPIKEEQDGSTSNNGG